MGRWRHRFAKYADSLSTREGRTGRAAFSAFSTLRPVFKNFQDLCGRAAKTMQYICFFAKEHFRVGSL